MAKIPIVLDNSRVICKNNQPKLDDLRYGAMVLVNKPLEWTSFDVVNKIRSSIKYGPKIKKIKVGHAGTLDPLAEGLLLVCIGKYTKLIDNLTIKNKSYKAVIKIGATTKTYDRESEEENVQDTCDLSIEKIKTEIKSFTGVIEQTPPIYSAIKIKGVSAHRLARRGKDVTLKARKIEISKFEILDWSCPLLTVNITCSKGTYIRSIANDLGIKLGFGGYLHDLLRTSIGHFSNENALLIDDVISWVNNLPETQKELG